ALVAMQERVSSQIEHKTAFGKFPILIKAGLGYGETRWQMFKSQTGKHLTYWMRGESLDGAVFAEKCADPSDIIVEKMAFERIKNRVEAESKEGAFRITKIISPLPTPSKIVEPTPDLEPSNLFFPKELLRQSIVGEFRHVVNLFIDIPLNISDTALVTPFMETVYALQEKYGGYFLRPELGDKGFNLLLLWGAPCAREHDIAHALNFIIDLTTQTKLTLRAGITYRMAYAGFIGAPLREDYTAYGWGVTLAARLMTYAKDGEFWLGEEMAKRARESFDVKFLGNYTIKGFAKTQATYQLLGKKPEARVIYQGNLVGRKAEIAQLESFIAPIRSEKSAGALMVTGEAGIGKSRLVYAFQNARKDFSTNWIRLHADEIFHDAFTPFKPWIKRRFGIVDDAPDVENWGNFSRAVDALVESLPDPELGEELKRTASVLSALVNLVPENSLYENLDAKARYENTFIALSVLLRAESLEKPLILLFEDAHWLDEDTEAFLAYFMRSLGANEEKTYPIAIIATRRPEGRILFPDNDSLQEIRLEKLTAENIALLAQDILDKPVAKELVSLLSSRAEGNPFFAEQILRYLIEENLLIFNENEEYTTDKEADNSLPLDIRAVLIARLDRLTQKVRETVQTASVLGREFTVDVLVEMLHSQLENLPKYVNSAEKAKIWAHISEIEYIFHHALLRDAAYSMQLETRQRGLHKLAFNALEEVYQDELEAYYGELAYHAEKGGLEEKALHYLSLAGERAKGTYQNRQAIEYYSRALTLLPREELRARFDFLLKRVESFYNLGDSPSQLKDLAQMEALAHKVADEGMISSTFIRQAYHASIMGDYPNAVKYATKAMDLALKTQNTEILLSAYIVLPDALSRTGKFSTAKERAKDGLEIARSVNNRHSEASALNALGLVVLELEGPTTAQEYQRRALAIAKEVKDHYLEAKILNNLAISLASQGDYHASRDYFQQALAVFRKQGNETGKGLALANLGWLSGILGDYPAAMKHYERSLIITRQLGQHHEEMYTYINLSASSYGQGLAEKAYDWAEKGFILATAIEDSSAQAWAYYYLGLAHLLDKKFRKAVEVLLRSLELRIESNIPAQIVETRAGLVQAYAALDNQLLAEKEAEAVIQYIEEDETLEGAEEPLRIYLFIYKWLEKRKDPRAPILLQKAKELMNTQVLKLNSKEAQQQFIENVPWRRALQNA
ncbi:MAG: hypothetical protein B6243_08580, partial [Anaerolineaceae bacterium 4572_5.2]